ncbi:hypothetical protein P9112_001999 [Eukaryota sp. TZLM1-RC]
MLHNLIQDSSRTAADNGYLLQFPVCKLTIPFFPHCSEPKSLLLLQKSNVDYKKPTHSDQSKRRLNPFLPFDPHSFVCEITDEHVILLNKFIAIEGHCLIVTKKFVPQWSPVTPLDSLALAKVLLDMDCLVFFNCGSLTGASQPHKHFQFLPLPLSNECSVYCPLNNLISDSKLPFGEVCSLPQFKFNHALVRFSGYSNEEDFQQLIHSSYISIMERLEIHTGHYTKLLECHRFEDVDDFYDVQVNLPCYSLIVTRKFMFIVRRKAASAFGIEANSSAFAGSLFVRTQEQLDHVSKIGLIGVLEELSEEK